MDKHLFFSLFAYSIYWLINFSTIMKKLREWLKKVPIMSELLGCSFCCGFWVGLFSCGFYGFGLVSVVTGLVVAILTYFIGLLDKLLQKHIVF